MHRSVIHTYILCAAKIERMDLLLIERKDFLLFS